MRGNGVTAPALKPYERQLVKWLPTARLEPAAEPGALLRWRASGQTITYVLECKPHLEHQDVRAVAHQLQQYGAQAGRRARMRVLLLAPFIRREQGAVLEQHDIDYVDLAGNAHLRAPGLLVHVEGVRPTAKPLRVRRRLTRGWIKTVMALLVRPALIQQPYRPIADAADVAPATVMTCLTDLKAGGFVGRERGTRGVRNAGELLALWVQAYVDVLRPKLAERNFQMKVVDKHERWGRLKDVMARHDVRWALTGADAALLADPHLRAEQTELYAIPVRFDEPNLLRELQAQPAVRGDLQVIEPPGPIVLEGEPDKTGIPAAPMLLRYAELRYRNNDQANEAADLLLPRVLARAEA